MTRVSGAAEVVRDFRVLVLPAGALMAEALAMALRAAGLDVRLAVACPPESALSAIDTLSPDIALIDLGHGQCLGGRRKGEEMCAGQDPRCVDGLLAGLQHRLLPAIIVVDETTLPIVDDAVAMGIGAVVTASESMEKVLAMIDRHRARGTMMREPESIEIPRELAGGSLRSARALLSQLTPREKDVLLALARGQRPSMIAESAELSVETVRSHIRSIRQKLGVTSQLQAVALANQAGWLSSDPPGD